MRHTQHTAARHNAQHSSPEHSTSRQPDAHRVNLMLMAVRLNELSLITEACFILSSTTKPSPPPYGGGDRSKDQKSWSWQPMLTRNQKAKYRWGWGNGCHQPDHPYPSGLSKEPDPSSRKRSPLTTPEPLLLGRRATAKATFSAFRRAARALAHE
eukprot:scaffold16121_cov112-Isochrysis_galbana.AAC.2